jgi:hypothetical protein
VKAKRVVRKTAFGSMLAMVCFGVFALAGSTPAQEGASGYHLLKKVQPSGVGGWDYLAIDSESRRLFISQGTHMIVLNADTGDVVGDIANTPGVHGVAVARNSDTASRATARTTT